MEAESSGEWCVGWKPPLLAAKRTHKHTHMHARTKLGEVEAAGLASLAVH